jgi:hypothetical protein
MITEERFNELKENILNSLENVLIEKNKKYGNAALAPIKMFYNGDASTSIRIRLDDKISRIKNSDTLRKNDMFDILGYVILLGISENVWDIIDDEMDFEQKINIIVDNAKNDINFESWDQQKTIFQKTSSSLFVLDCLLRSLNKEYDLKDVINSFIIALVRYFIEIECDNFEELID